MGRLADVQNKILDDSIDCYSDLAQQFDNVKNPTKYRETFFLFLYTS